MLVLVRHGESTANADGLLLGRTDAPLTEKGRRQVAALATMLGPVARLISSPLTRARDTASALGLSSPLEIDDRWIEVDYGEHEGRPLGDVPAEIWQRWRSDPDFAPESGESLGEVARRVGVACDELFADVGTGARRGDGDVVVVSHVSPIKAAVAWAIGADAGLAWRLHLSTGSLTRIGWSNTGAVLHSFNEVPIPPSA
ncbi:MAG: histidine phosphatase family protein [Acidimicrobiales bacterium]